MNAKKYMRAVCHLDSTDEVEWCVHPGGRKILDALRDEKFSLGLDKHHLRHSYETLRLYGNMSSPTIFYVIQRMIDESRAPDAATRSTAFCLGFGPGLTVEIAGLHRIE